MKGAERVKAGRPFIGRSMRAETTTGRGPGDFIARKEGGSAKLGKRAGRELSGERG